uniref:Reverse transcriptase domain-containing protein n=1 Tax=Tanacetum cinerariifolium TaxID=118510 RepID=A0A6L2LJG1_TANCI|nr:hypothetical protein [Tanacetum cinerariifolium]GEU60377.1 hypothetical protein [Tanacetum cinerariifolium]
MGNGRGIDVVPKKVDSRVEVEKHERVLELETSQEGMKETVIKHLGGNEITINFGNEETTPNALNKIDHDIRVMAVEELKDIIEIDINEEENRAYVDEEPVVGMDVKETNGDDKDEDEEKCEGDGIQWMNGRTFSEKRTSKDQESQRGSDEFSVGLIISMMSILARILELKRRYFEDYCSDNQYAVSIKKDTVSYDEVPPKSKNDMPLRDKMDDPNITIEEYVRLEEEKARKRDFVTGLDRIYKREVHRVQIFDFRGLPYLMAKGLSARMLMECRDAQGAESARQIPNKEDLRDYWIGISSAGDFLCTTPSYTSIRDPILRLCHRYLRLFAAGRKSEALISGGQFVARLAEHFRLLTKERLRGLTAWVTMGLKRQPDAAAGAPRFGQDDLVTDEGDQAVPKPVQEPPPPPATARTMPQRMARLEEDVHKIREALADQREVIGTMARDFLRFTVWAANGIAQLLDSARVAYHTRGASDAGLTVPAPPQPSRTSSSQTHDPPILIFYFYLTKTGRNGSGFKAFIEHDTPCVLGIQKMRCKKVKDHFVEDLWGSRSFGYVQVEARDSLRMGDEHLDTIPEKESDELIKSSVENLVPNPSDSKDEHEFIFDEDIPKEIYLNPLFDEIDSLLDEFAGELILLKSIPLGIDEADCDPEEEIRLIKKLFYDNSSPRPPEEFISKISDASIESFSPSPILVEDSNSLRIILLKSIPLGIDEADCDPEEEIRFIKKLFYDNSSPRPPEEFISKISDASIESFSPSPILVEDSNSLRDEIDLSLTPDVSMPPGIEDDNYDSEGDILILEELLSNDSLSLPKMSHFILIFHHSLALLRNHQMMMKLSPIR